ncbi:MAG: WD40-repeat-containing domain protein [Benniella sp.]|nr:MAG: WD40-repeat-containing domain protein [Benniella sp.]
MKQRLKEQTKSVYIPPQAKAGFHATDSARYQLMERVQDFLGSDQKVFLLLGDSGAGKSTFNRALECNLWRAYKKGGLIPLFINLPAIENPDHDMISKQLRKLEFTESQIGELKIRRKFILICDAYDESQQTHNLYTTNRLNQPGEWEAKMVISCRSEHLGANYRDWFQPGDRDRSSEFAQYQEAVILPFTTEQVNSYINQYVAIHQPLWEAKEYKLALDLVPSLKELVKNPFLMSLSLDVLPRMVDSRHNFMTTRITKVSLYDHFVEHWLEQGKKRLGEKELNPQARAAFESLSDEGFTENGIDFLKKLAVAIYKEQDGRPVVEYSRYKDETSWKAEFFSREDKQLLREACPIVRNGNQYSFIHRSLLEYGLARGIFDPQDSKKRTAPQPTLNRRGSANSVLSFEMHAVVVKPQIMDQEPDIESPLAWRSFVNESSLLEFLAERVHQGPIFKQQLLDYIEYSKRDKKWRRAAANAITILVRSGIQFNSADLRGIQIPGADISYGMFDFAQLQGADLRKVNLRNVSLRQAGLSGAQMTSVQFGGLPYLTEDGSARSCAYSPGGVSFAVGLDHGDISVYTTLDWDKKWTLRGHSGLVTSVVYSPDGDRIASASVDATIRLWDVRTGVCCQVFIHDKGVESVVYSPLGDSIASCSADKTIQIWEVETGDCRHTLSGHTDTVSEIVYSPKGDHIASGGYDQKVRLWDVAAGVCHHTLGGHRMEVTSIVFSPRGDIVASGSRDETLRIWDVATGTCLHLLMGHMYDVSCIVFSPTGSQIASASKDGTVKLWDVDAGICCHTFTDHGRPVYGVAYSPLGDRIAASSDDTVILWDAQTRECSHTFSKPLAQMSMFLFSPIGDHVASATETGAVCLWDLGPRSTRNIATEHSGSVLSVKCSPKGHQVVSCSKDKAIRLWDMETGSCRQILADQSSHVYDVSYSPRGNLIASCHSDKTVRLWDIESGACLHILAGHTGAVQNVAFSPRGRQVASSSKDKTIRLWDVETGSWCRTLTGHSDRVYMVLYSPGGDQIASVSDDKTIRLWNMATEASQHTLVGHTERISSAVYSPNESQIASGSWDKEVRLWDTNTGMCLHVLSGHNDKVRYVAYSPQGDQVASASWDCTIRLWDVETAECRHTLAEHSYPVELVAFCPRGRLLASGSMNGEARLWDVKTGECRQAFEYDDQNSTTSYGIPLHRMSWVLSGDGDSLVTCGEDGSVRMWQVIDDEDTYRLHMRWRSTNGQLALEGVCTQDVQGLSEFNKQLLELPGIVDEHVHHLEEIEKSIRPQSQIEDFNLLR